MSKFTILFLLFALSASAQEALPKVKVTPVTAQSLSAIAKASDKKNTLFYTFGIWCEPCRLHLPTAIKLAKDHNLDFYVIIVDSQTSDKTKQAASYLYQQDKNIKMAVLSDEAYGVKTGKRNKKFVKEVTPASLENIDDYSKYILLDNTGKVLMVTNYKDNKDNERRDDSKMVQKRIVPLITK